MRQSPQRGTRVNHRTFVSTDRTTPRKHSEGARPCFEIECNSRPVSTYLGLLTSCKNNETREILLRRHQKKESSKNERMERLKNDEQRSSVLMPTKIPPLFFHEEACHERYVPFSTLCFIVSGDYGSGSAKNAVNQRQHHKK